MDRQAPLYLLIGFVLGAILIWIVKPEDGAAPAETLLDGKYLVVENDYGTWVYERQADGKFKPALKEMTPRGLRTIWELQAEFQPKAVKTGQGEILYVAGTQYSSESGSFAVNYVFYEFKDGKLVEIPIERIERPQR